MSAVSIILLALAAAGTLYHALAACALVRRRSCVPASPPLPQGRGSQIPSPLGGRVRERGKVSVLKPVSGLDPNASDNFSTFLAQDYPDYEVLFGVLDVDDPALSTICETVPRASVHIGSGIDGANNKVRILHKLAEHAGGDILVITDSDVRVPPDFLSRITAPFADERVGVVSCFYRGEAARTLGDRLHALHMSCVFAPGVACAERLHGLDFALGAAIAIRRSALDRIGGYEAIADYLADDFQLGYRAARSGWRVVLSDCVVDVVLGGERVRATIARELRWHVAQRVSRPWGYAGIVFTHGWAFALAFAASVGFTALGWGALLGASLVRFVGAWAGARKGLGDRTLPRYAYLLPLRDLLTFGVWIAGFVERTVTWRGRKLRIVTGGRIVEAQPYRVR